MGHFFSTFLAPFGDILQSIFTITPLFLLDILSILPAILYVMVLIAVCVKIIIETETPPSRTLAYLLLVISFPIVGIIFYLSIGQSYRKNKLYQKKLEIDENIFPEIQSYIRRSSLSILDGAHDTLGHFSPLIHLLGSRKIISENNNVKLLINGEKKFPQVIEDLRKAQHHIHMEYYIYEDDIIGNTIADILIQKAQEGVKVRYIYDALGSRGIKHSLVKRLRAGGVEAYPFYEVTSLFVLNRINYRNHRKIIVIDGITGYVGGINIADEYINPSPKGKYWRDTHIRIIGESVMNLQAIFLMDWNFCAKQQITFSPVYFPGNTGNTHYGKTLVSMVVSGPDSDHPDIMYALIQAILLSRKEICITTPYFIPDKSFLDALKIAALSGVSVKLLVPGIGDSRIVNLTSRSFYQSLLEVGVQIYRYQRGFVHAKTLVFDRHISFVGTANLDNRSFDLNFEVSAVLYDKEISENLVKQFELDIIDAKEITLEAWENRPLRKRFLEKLMNLASPLM